MLNINNIIDKSIEVHRQRLAELVYSLKVAQITKDKFIVDFSNELRKEYIRQFAFINKSKYITRDILDIINNNVQNQQQTISDFAELILNNEGYNDVSEFADKARYMHNLAIENYLHIKLPFLPNSPESTCKKCRGYWELEEIDNRLFAFWNTTSSSCVQCRDNKTKYNPIEVTNARN